MLDKLLKSLELKNSSDLNNKSGLPLNKNNDKLDDFWRVKNIINLNSRYNEELLNKKKEIILSYEWTYDSIVDISSWRVEIKGSKRELASLYIHDLADNKRILEINKDKLWFINLYKNYNLKINNFKYSSSDNITRDTFTNSIKLPRNNYLVPQNKSDIFDLMKFHSKYRQTNLSYLNRGLKLKIISNSFNFNEKLNNKNLDFITRNKLNSILKLKSIYQKKTKVIWNNNISDILIKWNLDITNLSYLFFKYPRLIKSNDLNDFWRNKYNTNIYLELNNVIKKEDIIPSILDKNRYKKLKKFSIFNKINGKLVLDSPRKVNLYKKYNFSDFNIEKELSINVNKYYTFSKKLLVLNNFNFQELFLKESHIYKTINLNNFYTFKKGVLVLSNFNFQEVFIKNVKKNNSSIINSFYRKTKKNIPEFINSRNSRLNFLIQIKEKSELILSNNSKSNILDLELLNNNNTLKCREKIILKLNKKYTLSEINNKKTYKTLDIKSLSEALAESKYISNVLSWVINNDNEIFKSLITLDKRLEFYIKSFKNYLLEYKDLFKYSYKKILIKFNYSKFKLIWVITSWVIIILWISGISAKTYLEYSIKNNYNNLASINISDLETTSNNLNKITKNIESDYKLFKSISFFWDNIFYKDERVAEANNILEWWIYLTQAWNLLLKEANKINTSFNKNKNLITNILRQDKENILRILKLLKQAETSYNKIDFNNSVLAKNNVELQNNLLKLERVKNILNLINSKSDYINNNYDVLLEILWDKKPINYLVLNQNRDEIRASWWFIWSTINFELYKWTIKKLENRDVYFHDFNLINQETPPEWLDLISPNHWLRDANYSPVFLDNARKINYFYEKSWSSSLDIVVWINQWITKQILELTWPIKLNINPDLEIIINKDNFSEVMSTLVEAKIWKDISPKDILFAFIDKVKTNITNNKSYKDLAEIFINNVLDWEVLIASNNSKFQNIIDDLQIVDKWKFDNWNIVYPVFTSISWNKSDRYLSRNFSIDSKEIKECVFQNTITLNTSHNMWESDTARIKLLLNNLWIISPNEIFESIKIQWNWPNNSFIRIIVPKNSKIISNNLSPNSNSRSIKLVKHDNYSEISFYQKVFPTKSNSITISYLSSPTNCDSEIKFYKQPWLQNITVN